MDRLRCDQTVAWSALRTLAAEDAGRFDLRQAFASDPGRFAAFSQQAPHVFADLSKNLIDARTEALLFALARQCELERYRDAMFAGEAINQTEQRAVKHWLLRMPPADDSMPGAAPSSVDADLPQVHATLDAMLAYAESVRGAGEFSDIVHLGIGGSDLGPQMVVRALAAFAGNAPRLHFVSNVDGHALDVVLRALEPAHTLFLVASKTFTTQETLCNAASARRWCEAAGADIARHFCALTSNVAAARAWGVRTSFDFQDWVGGRYSLWSAIGLPIAIAIGADGFRALLGGAHAMDQHFRQAPLARNLPVRLGLLDVWYRNFLGFASRSIAPYHSALERWPAFLQQLEMESNGKRVDLQGRPLGFGTAPVLWGEPGTNGQHAFFQLLHQGTDVVPVEFLAVRQPQHALAGHHALLLANALAQAQALMQGCPSSDGHRDFPGNRPSTFLLLEALTPQSLGALIALHEHRVFVSGALWGIDSFDQWGVELGKQLGVDIAQRMASGDLAGLDGSTAGLLRRLAGAAPDPLETMP